MRVRVCRWVLRETKQTQPKLRHAALAFQLSSRLLSLSRLQSAARGVRSILPWSFLSTMMESVLNSMHGNDAPQPEASSSSGAQRNSSTPSSSSAEPPPVPTLGPDYYELRRQEWLRPATPSASAAAASNDAQSTTSSSSSGTIEKKKSKAESDSSRARLESLLSVPGAEEDDELWKAYLHTVHDGLVGGKRFKKGIKLAVAVSCIS